MSDIRQLTRERAVKKGAFTRKVNNIRHKLSTNKEFRSNTLLIQSSIEDLTAAFNALESMHLQVLSSAGLEVEEEQEEFSNHDAYIEDSECNFSALKEDLKNAELYAIKTTESTMHTYHIEQVSQELDIRLSRSDCVPSDLRSKIDELENSLANYKTFFLQLSPPIDDIVVQYNKTRYVADTILQRATKVTGDAESVNTNRDDNENNGASNIQTRKVSPPIFDGLEENYYPWKANFRKNFESNTKKIAMLQLQEALEKGTGGPRELITHLAVNGTLEDMFKQLDKKYGDKRRISRKIIQRVENIPPCISNDVPSFRNLYETLDQARSQLKAIDCESHLAHYNSVTTIERKLPPQYKIDWARKAIGDDITVDNKFDELMKFIEVSVAIADHMADMGTTEIEQQADSNITTISYRASNEHGQIGQFRNSCPLHQKLVKHTAEKCFLLKGARPEDQVNWFKNELHEFCKICIRTGHGNSGKDCPFKDKISKCTMSGCTRHHYDFLHDALNQLRSSEKQGQEVCYHAVDTNMYHGQSICPAHCAIVSAFDSKTSVSILYDSGANVSLIRNAVAEKLNLQKVNKQPQLLAFTTVSGETVHHKAFRYRVPLAKNTSSQPVYTIVAFGIERIGANLPPMKNDVKDAASVLGVTNEYENGLLNRPQGVLDILIGTDNVNCIPRISKSQNGLVLAENELGLVIYGSHESFRGKNSNQYHATVMTIEVTVMAIEVNSDQKTPDFFSTESFGVETCIKCGDCKCGTCPMTTDSISFKEQNELQMTRDLMSHDPQTNIITGGYPIIKDISDLQDNKPMAVKRAHKLEEQLEKDPVLAEQYKDQIHDMVNRDVAEILSKEKADAWSGPVQYLPHGPVIKPGSKTTPVRSVLDPKAKYRGKCVNDYWAKGPNLILNSMGLIIRFKEDQCAVLGDIHKFYQTVRTTPTEWHLHRFLWRDDKSKDYDVYIVTRNSFGSRPAGMVAIEAAKLTAKLGEDKYPHGAKFIRNQMYVDDGLDSFSSKSVAESVTKEVDQCLALGSFRIKDPGWLIVESPEENNLAYVSRPIIKTNFESSKHNSTPSLASDKTTNIEVPVTCEETTVLGIHWNITTDSFVFDPHLNFSKKKRKVYTGPNLEHGQIYDKSIVPVLSKRIVMSKILEIYDPLGYLGPFTMEMKFTLAKLFKFKYPDGSDLGWDDELPMEFDSRFRQLFDSMFDIKNIDFPRCLKPKNAVGNPWLLMCSDSSTMSFGAVAYIRWKLDDGKYWVRLIASKSRIWPIAPDDYISIERGELQGAVLAKRLSLFITQESRFNFEKILFIVDSQIVRAQIAKDAHSFNVFVGRRVAEIRKTTNPDQWYWAAGKTNQTADLLSRGTLDMTLLDRYSAWQNGLPFFYEDFENWPITQTLGESVVLPETRDQSLAYRSLTCITSETELETPREETHTVMKTNTGTPRGDNSHNETDKSWLRFKPEMEYKISERIDCTKFNNLEKLLGATVRFCHALSWKPGNGHFGKWMADLGIVEPRLREKAKEFWLRCAQKDVARLVSAGKLTKYCPYTDDAGIIRANGRFKMGEGYHPIILTGDHPYVKLLVAHIHRRGHNGVTATMAKVRSQFYILGLHKLVVDVRQNCVTCRYLDHKVIQVPMAKLPTSRVRAYLPFEHSSCDLFGPFSIKQHGRNTRNNPQTIGKAYGLLFTCLSTRAIHCETMEGAETNAFLLAFRRMMSIRGQPRTVWSDNGGQIVAADQELKPVIEQWDEKKLKEFGSIEGIEWTFCSPGAPWQNGVTESLIGTVKKTLKTVMCEKPKLPVLELQTIFYEVASLVNERPLNLATLSNAPDVEVDTYLCPNQLLLGRATSKIAAGPIKPSHIGNMERFHENQKIITEWWQK